MTARAQKTADGVWQSPSGLVLWRARDTQFLEAMAPLAAKLRARICLHQPEERTHQMIIAFAPGSANPWHAHEKMESLLVLSGEMQVEFENEVLLLAAGDYLRIPAGVQHRPIPVTDCVVLETAEK